MAVTLEFFLKLSDNTMCNSEWQQGLDKMSIAATNIKQTKKDKVV